MSIDACGPLARLSVKELVSYYRRHSDLGWDNQPCIEKWTRAVCRPTCNWAAATIRSRVSHSDVYCVLANP